MKIFYVGHYVNGSTSKMRGEYLNKILKPNLFKIANLDIPIQKTSKIFSSLGWRYKFGPFIKNINNYIIGVINNDWHYDLVWIDKGVFIDPEVIEKLRKQSNTLVHYTPDPAFTYHQSHLFYKAIPYYDYCITTKSFEIKDYEKFSVKTIFCTQGFDPQLHKPFFSFEQKKGVVFIGHYEEERAEIVAKLLEAKVQVNLAGIKWSNFVKKYKHNNYLYYKGSGLFGVDYSNEISSALIGLGLLSKWIPELHTTRTFEIPACGTALATEYNDDTKLFFEKDEVLFYENKEHLIFLIKKIIVDPISLKILTLKGYERINQSKKDYHSILENILSQINFK